MSRTWKTYGEPLAEKIRLRAIDESNIRDHARLTLSDKCLFLYEYTSGANYTASSTNDLISNLKKKPSERLSKGGYHYKGKAIERCISDLKQALNPKWLEIATLVPTPSSRVTGDPDYDDRMEQICRGLFEGADVRNLIHQTASTPRSHEAAPGERLTVEQLLNVYRIDEALTSPTPRQIGIFDDVLTAGTHFRAMSATLGARFPGVRITGIFIARRVWADEEQEWDF